MQVLAEYPSSTGKSIHQVRIGDDGKMYCTCPGWRLHSQRWCKHLEHYTNTHWSDNTIRPDTVTLTGVEAVTQQVIIELKGAGYGR